MATEVGFIGLGSMGLGMANNLLRHNDYAITGYDIWQPSVEKFTANGGQSAASPRATAENSTFLILMAASAAQIDSILFDDESGALKGLPQNAIIMICSTVPPIYYGSLPTRIAEYGRPDVLVVDSPVSGGPIRAANGTLTIFAAGEPDVLSRADGLLNTMAEKLYIIDGGLGAGSKVKMVNQLLVGTQIAAACEAIAFATTAGLDGREVFNIVKQTSGHSWAFNDRVPHILDEDWTPHSALNIFVKDMGIVVSTARSVEFPVPVASVAEQLYISASSQGLGKEDDAGLVRLLLRGTHKVAETKEIVELASDIQKTPFKISTVAAVGLDGFGQSLISSLLKGGFAVTAYDSDKKTVDDFLAHGGRGVAAKSPSDAALDANILLLGAKDARHATDLLLGTGKIVQALPENAVVILIADTTADEVQALEKNLSRLNRGLKLIDAPLMESNNSRFESGLAMVYSGRDATISKVNSIFISLGRVVDVFRVKGNAGSASTVKLVNQMLVGIHVVAACEAMSLAAYLGLSTGQIYELLRNAAAWSWVFETRVPKMLQGDWESPNTTGIISKDLATILDEAKRLMFWAPLTSAAHNIYLSAVTKGWGSDADASLARLYETDKSTVVVRAAKSLPKGNAGGVNEIH